MVDRPHYFGDPGTLDALGPSSAAGLRASLLATGGVGEHRLLPSDGGESSVSDSDLLASFERDVNTLNRCFDEIERFVSRVQEAAIAQRELATRQSRNRRGQAPDRVEAVLTIRAQLPSEPEFVDVFQKFKLSFNLLAKLRNNISEPNAPELLHFLFTPLTVIMDACRYALGENIAPRIVSPLISRDAKELMHNCLNNKEIEIWYSLGDAWRIPGEDWPHARPPPYFPRFYDGTMPYGASANGRNLPIELGGYRSQRSTHHRRASPARLPRPNTSIVNTTYHHNDLIDRDRATEPPPAPEVVQPSTGDMTYETDKMILEKERMALEKERLMDRERRLEEEARRVEEEKRRLSEEQRRLLDEQGRHVLANNARLEQAVLDDVYFRKVNCETKGSRVDVAVNTDAKDDKLHQNGGLETDDRYRLSHSQEAFLAELEARRAKAVQVTHDRLGNNAKELSVSKYEYLEVLDDSKHWWECRSIRSRVGFVPNTIVKVISWSRFHATSVGIGQNIFVQTDDDRGRSGRGRI